MIPPNPKDQHMEKPKVIVIVGPTAVGKTSLSIEVAQFVGGEILSADSRQVYTGLDIGTGKVTKKEMRGVPHHLLDIADPRTTFTAADFIALGTDALNEVLHKEKVPIVVGGTGFYIDALLGRTSLAHVPPNEELRATLEKMEMDELQNALKERDPERYETIDVHNRRRLIRALEIVEALGKTPPPQTESPYTVLWLGLNTEKDTLKKNIHQRLLERLDSGMVEEVEQLHANGLTYERMEELGLEYRYVGFFLQKKITREEMVSELEKEINHYAKRQMTWFKRNKDIQWFEPNEKEKILEAVKIFLN